MRVPSEQKNCIEADIGTTRYRAKNGYFEMPDHHAKMWLKATGQRAYIDATPVRRGGYKCGKCGWEGWFKKCGKCGYGRCKRLP